MTNNRAIAIKGIGRATAAPDLIVLVMNLEVLEPDYERTILRSTESIEMLRAAVVAAGHDGKDLKTTSFKINTKYESYQEHKAWKQRFMGYVCSHGLKLEFDFDMSVLGATLGKIAECDVDPDFSIKFSIKDPNAISAQLLESAIENAQAKAMILTRSAGVKLGAIQRIDYNWSELHIHSNTDINVSEGILLLDAVETLGMEIEPEDISISDTVTVVWSIE